ncbi:hypothetical protein GGI07_005657 [Coemansia sp. Benny D115]|nr:hypothetical protein GGI07_005657 [Coemansia sp. Benny D115]
MATPLFSQGARGAGSGGASVPGALVEFKAGRLFRDSDSNWVRPDARRGVCYVAKGDDGLLRFAWRDAKSNRTEEELIVFPGDVTLEKVKQSSGRVYVVKFLTSSHRSFFWMQGADAEQDAQIVKRVNAALNIGNDEDEDDGADEEEEEEEYVTPAALRRRSSREAEVLSRHREQSALASEALGGLQGTLASAQVGGVPGGNLRRASMQQPGDDITHMGTGGLGGGRSVGREELSSLRRLLADIQVPEGAGARGQAGLHLGDVLTRENLAAVLGDAALRRTLFPHLPEGVEHDEASLDRVIGSAQFRQALGSLSYVLETGQMAPLVRQLGLDAEAGTSVEAFIRAIARQAKNDGDDEDAEMQG